MATKQRTKPAAKTSSASSSAISIQGSTKIVTEFFEFSVNTQVAAVLSMRTSVAEGLTRHSILYQRGLYPPEDFKMVKKYGLNMLVSSDDSLVAYLRKIMSQLNNWLMAGKVSRLVMAIISKETRQVLERWQFEISLEGGEQGEETKENQPSEHALKKEKTEKEIHAEIQAIIRQITASVTFLPVIEEKCSFNILVYTGQDTEVPNQWQEDDAHMISGTAEQVRLRSFATSVHKVDALVAYRLGED
ncbi:MAG: Mitotic spindle checkpoint component mad2 [Cyphobasidiales sp. Tagirdzhanova-0007]|nr:MAG: Mitotic spindle checkpoint component mad2 [Cyphobasidiales sp. Tagirdzhanova-0007]